MLFELSQQRPQVGSPIGSNGRTESVNTKGLCHLAVLGIIIDEECLIGSISAFLQDSGEDLRIRFDQMQLTREPQMLEEFRRHASCLDEITLTISPMHQIGIGERRHMISLSFQVGDNVQPFVRYTVRHTGKGTHNLSVIGQLDTCPIGMFHQNLLADLVTEGLEGQIPLLDFAQRTLLMCQTEHLLDAAITKGLELLDTTVGTQVKQHATEIKNYIFKN